MVTDSWGDTLGDLLTDAGTKTAFDNTFLLAGATGVSVLFSSGDSGDNFAISGLTAPDYPASSPFITAVGGTTLEVNKSNGRQAEYGWSTAKQVLCSSSQEDELRQRDHPDRHPGLAGRRWRRDELHLHPALLPGGDRAERARAAQRGSVRPGAAAGRARTSRWTPTPRAGC